MDMVLIAAGAALLAVCSWISIPMTVPFTMQTFAVFFLLLLLGGRRGTAAVLVFLLLGAAGAPVFAEFSGGIGILLGQTGGYMIGFLLTGVSYLLMTRFFGEKRPVQITSLLIGLVLCYTFGTLWFAHVYAADNGPVGLWSVLGWCVFPYVLPDLLKMALAFVLEKRVSAALKSR